MKRLVLMGGRPWLGSDHGKSFANTLFRYFPEEVKLAFCIFAQPETDWRETKEVNQKMFSKYKGKRKLSYKTMTSKNFDEVSKWADIIYIPGGDPFILKQKIDAIGDVGELWDGKVIAGSSAGADLFCIGFVYLQEKTFGQGLGWVKATCIPHWRGDFNDYNDKDWDWAEKESLKKFPEFPVLCIPETEFVEYTIK